MNEETNKSHVAIRKILKYHPNIDMKPLFEWGANEDGEQTLKALPHVVDRFERAKEAVQVMVTEKIIMLRRDNYLQYFSLHSLCHCYLSLFLVSKWMINHVRHDTYIHLHLIRMSHSRKYL